MKTYVIQVTNGSIDLMLHRETNSFGDQILTLYCYHIDGTWHIPWSETNYEGEHVTISDEFLRQLRVKYGKCQTKPSKIVFIK